jgi:NADPH-dependent 2,4-dienoyl-CoA reductase/sulfur reductase-like enzyme/nitrite reductase/ring-hydroxylating ferredoxin subunit
MTDIGELPAQGLHEIEVEGEKVLLFRDGETITAVAGTCPHAGGPLAQGVRNGKRLVCPWHKATFCLATGAVLEPPAVDPLARWEVRSESGRIALSRPSPAIPPAPGTDPRRFVIIGAGAAGAVAAQHLRELGFAGRILMLDRDNRVPYDRTLLSKYVLSGERGGEKSPLQTQAFYRQHGIERLTEHVRSIDVASRRIACASGAEFQYDAALLAPGGTPRRPDLPGAELAGVFLLRSRADADALLAQAERSGRAVVLGASFIGMEVAASLRERGLDVTVVGKERAPFQKQLGERIGRAFTGLHERQGVAFRLGQAPAAIEGGPAVRAVRLQNGERLAADLVVIGFGIAPATKDIDGIPKNEDGSVAVDATLRLADCLYAAGDVARFPLFGSGDPIRVEHWRVAQQHGRVAAANMLGRACRYDPAPVFWTIQYRKRLDYVGHADRWDDIVVHGDLNEPNFLAYYVGAGRVRAVCGLDRDRDTAAVIELFGMRQDWTAAELGPHPAALLDR